MRTDWREVPRDNVIGQWAALYVTMNRKGFLVMSRLTFQRMGEPKAVILLFDQVNNRIGLKPAQLSTRNAYHIGPSGSHGGKMVRAYRLMQEFGIVIPETIRFQDPEIDEDGILILDLRNARVSTRGATRIGSSSV